MAIDAAAVRAGMKSLLQNSLGGEVQIATAPDQITPPCLFIGQPSTEYHRAFRRGMDEAIFPLFAIFPRTHDQAAVDRSDAWVSGEGPESIVTIVNSDKTLSGSCQSSWVVRSTAEIWPGATGELPAYNFEVQVYA